MMLKKHTQIGKYKMFMSKKKNGLIIKKNSGSGEKNILENILQTLRNTISPYLITNKAQLNTTHF